ncbi:MAG: GNAT family N-acetyltransferase [Theionarchaea archaeon]|nr:GNAT family N-acetyltransferase [Theionarchaea archaeon]
MEVTISNTIQDVDEKEWELLVGTDRVDGSHSWFRTVEESGYRDMRYALVRERKKLVAAACCRLYNEKLLIRIPLLGVGPVYTKTDEETAMLLQGLEEIRKKENARGILFFFHDEEELNLIKNVMKGSTVFSMKENTYIDLNFTDFEDYLSSLNAVARRSIRSTVNKAHRQQIQPLFSHEFSTWKETAHRLQGYLCEEHQDYSSHLSEQFYEILEKNLKDAAELLILLKDDIALAFALAFNSSSISLYKFGGVDPEYRKYQGYFLIYYEGIRKAIERGQKRIYFGPSTYEFKEKIGCKREKTFGLVKMAHPLLNLMVKCVMTIYNILGRRL